MRKIGIGHFETTDAMRANVQQVLDTGRLSYGPFCKELEQRFAEMHGCKYAVLSNSGTDSLRIALATLKELHNWKDGDEVIVPSVTFVATANIILQCNLKPILVDVEPDYYGIDVTKIPEAVTSRTRCIIPVHLFGMPCDMDNITRLDFLNAFLHDGPHIKIIQDSCECMIATHHDLPVGIWSEIACFSTYMAHLLTTGVGGIATTNNPDYAIKMRSLVNHGRDSIYLNIDDDDEHSTEVMERRFNFESIGYSSRITEFEAAIGCAQLDDLPAQIKKRQENMVYLTSGLQHLDKLQLPKIRPFTTHSAMMFAIVLPEGSKWDLCDCLEKRGIETREMLRLTDQLCYKGMWNPDDYPVAKWLNEQGFYVGIHHGLTKDDLDYMIETIGGYFK